MPTGSPLTTGRPPMRPGVITPDRQTVAFPTPEVVALADLAAVAGYMVGVSPAPFQAVAIAVKLALVLVSRNRVSGLAGGGVPLVVLVGTAAISALFSRYDVLGGLGQYVLVSVNVAATLVVLRPTSFNRYVRALGILTSAISVIYMLMAGAGMIANSYGRLLYFGGAHPNLGSEIAAIGVIALCLTFSLTPLRVVVLSVPNLLSALLMQGRAGMLVIVAAVAIRLYVSTRRRGMGYLVGAVMLLLVATPVAVLLGGESVRADVSRALLLDDSYRGVGTGLVGRDNRWAGGINMFFAAPLTGGGPDVFRSREMLTPHNWFLYGVGELGSLFLLVLFFFARAVVAAYRNNRAHVLILSPVLLLMMLNDRFMNLNAYPALMYVFLFALASWPVVLPTRPRRRRDA